MFDDVSPRDGQTIAEGRAAGNGARLLAGGARAEPAIALANGTGYGLAAAAWSSNITTAHRVARRLRAGTVWINTFDISSLTTPFGGVKDSGQGRDQSLDALDAHTHLKTTWVSL